MSEARAIHQSTMAMCVYGLKLELSGVDIRPKGFKGRRSEDFLGPDHLEELSKIVKKENRFRHRIAAKVGDFVDRIT